MLIRRPDACHCFGLMTPVQSRTTFTTRRQSEPTNFTKYIPPLRSVRSIGTVQGVGCSGLSAGYH